MSDTKSSAIQQQGSGVDAACNSSKPLPHLQDSDCTLDQATKHCVKVGDVVRKELTPDVGDSRYFMVIVVARINGLFLFGPSIYYVILANGSLHISDFCPERTARASEVTLLEAVPVIADSEASNG